MRRWWPLAAVLVAQLGVLAFVPMRTLQVRATGTPVTLRTRPIDPYDLLSGYYVTLAYEVEEEAARELGRRTGEGETVWILLEPGEPAWRYAGVRSERPAEGVAVPATLNRDFRIDGAGRLYIPESQRERADRLTRRDPAGGLVDLRVGRDGHVALLRLRIAAETFGE